MCFVGGCFGVHVGKPWCVQARGRPILPAAPKDLPVYLLGGYADYGYTGGSCREHETSPKFELKPGQRPHGDDWGGRSVYTGQIRVYNFRLQYTSTHTSMCKGSVRLQGQGGRRIGCRECIRCGCIGLGRIKSY